MASSKEYLFEVLDGLPDSAKLNFRPMMGEYILYYREKVIGGIYDNRLLIKPTPSSVAMMPEAAFVLPYDGAKEMLHVPEGFDKRRLSGIFEAMYPELPAPKKRK